MPIHDWTRVRANRFHDFHQSWMVAIRNTLNAGRLPEGYFAMVEQITGGPEPDVVALEMPHSGDTEPTGGLAVQTQPPQTRIVERVEPLRYAEKANRVTIRHPDGDVVAIVEILSPGNKGSRNALRSFVEKMIAFLRHGVHLLLVDLFPPSKRDPQGIHKAIWDELTDSTFVLPEEKSLTAVSYSASGEIVAYVEPIAVGDVLPEMPIFLRWDTYIQCPLEETYQTAWDQFPPPLREPLLSPG